MDGSAFKKVRGGDPLTIHAEAWNGALDAIAYVRQQTRPRGGSPTSEHFQHALVLNDTGAAIPRHHVLAISGPAILPHDFEDEEEETIPGNLDGFSDRLRLRGVEPAANDQDLAVTLEPIPAGFFGRCCVSGLAPALVDIDDEDHTAAQAQTGTMPISSSRGPLQIVWKQDEADRETEGVALCLVRILGGRTAGGMFAVLVTQTGGSTGGSAGSNTTTTCTFTYTVKDLYGVVIGTNMAPQKRFQPDTPYLAGGTDIPGTAYYDQDGVLQLFDPNALLHAEAC